MSNFKEIEKALIILSSPKHTIMQCSSIYPCPPKEVGLNLITKFKIDYRCNVGFSDHTKGFAASIAAITLGAKTIEKHVTFSTKMYGSDAKNSIELNEFKKFCDEIKFLDTALRNPVNKDKIKRYGEMRKTFMKSIVAKHDIKKNTLLKLKNLTFKKPGDGILVKNYKFLIGKKVKRNIKKDQKIKMNDVE